MIIFLIKMSLIIAFIKLRSVGIPKPIILNILKSTVNLKQIFHTKIKSKNIISERFAKQLFDFELATPISLIWFLAVTNNHTEILKILFRVSSPAEIDEQYFETFATLGCIDAFKLPGIRYEKACAFVAAYTCGRLELVKYFISEGFDPFTIPYFMNHLITTSRGGVLSYIVHWQPHKVSVSNIADMVHYRRNEIVQYLFENGFIDTRTLFEMACKYGNPTVIRMLPEIPTDIFITTTCKYTWKTILNHPGYQFCDHHLSSLSNLIKTIKLKYILPHIRERKYLYDLYFEHPVAIYLYYMGICSEDAKKPIISDYRFLEEVVKEGVDVIFDEKPDIRVIKARKCKALLDYIELKYPQFM